MAATALGAATALALAACGSSASRTTATTPATAAPGSSSAPPSSSSPGASFSTANIAGLGTVVVDGRGHTVYLLTSGDHKNVPCEDATGCTKVWPDLALPAGVSAPTAGRGVQASLLGTMKLANGETYPTYKGWLMYEFVGDSGPAQSHGEGIHSFGGTWHAISASGEPISVGSSSTMTTGGSANHY